MDDERDWKAVGARLKAARKSARLTQQEAAEKAGVHAVSVSRWEGGQPIREGDLKRLAEVYRVTIAALLGEDVTPEPDRAPTAEELLPGYWRGALRTILAHHDRVGDELRDFLAAGARWEPGSLIAAGVLAPAPSQPTETPAERKARLQREELEVEEQAVQARRARLAREAEEAKHAAEQAAQPPARRASGRR